MNNWPVATQTTNQPVFSPRIQTGRLARTESRQIANVESRTKLQAVKAHNQTKLHMFEAELRKMEQKQLLNNVNEIMNEAVGLAADNPGKLEFFIQIVLRIANNEMSIYELNHNPLLGMF